VAWRPLLEVVQNRQKKSGRFACAGLGARKDIVAPEDYGNGLRLDWSRGVIPYVANGA